MVYVTSDGQVLQSKPWGVGRLMDIFWGMITFFSLFFKTLVDPSLNKKGDGYATDYRSTGGRGGPPGGGPRRRFGGFSTGQAGPASAPPAGGG